MRDGTKVPMTLEKLFQETNAMAFGKVFHALHLSVRSARNCLNMLEYIFNGYIVSVMGKTVNKATACQHSMSCRVVTGVNIYLGFWIGL